MFSCFRSTVLVVFAAVCVGCAGPPEELPEPLSPPYEPVPTPTTPSRKYDKLLIHWDHAAQEAEELAERGLSRSDTGADKADLVLVRILVNTRSADAANDLSAWLTARDITYQPHSDGGSLALVAWVPYQHLGDLSQLRAVAELAPGSKSNK